MTTTPPNPPPSTEDKDKESVSAGTLRGWIREEIGNLIPSGLTSTKDSGEQQSGKSGATSDIKTEVMEALKLLKTREAREARDKEVDEMLAERKAPPKETTPVEHRRIEKFMRWSYGEDDK